MSPRRLRLTLMLAGVALNGLIFAGWTQQWLSVELQSGPVLRVDGDVAAPAVSTLALTGLALIGALAIAGPVFRVVLGALQALLGATIGLSAGLAIAGPVAASSAAVTKATGIAGDSSVAALVASAGVGAWPYLTLAAAALLVVLGVLTVAWARRWPASSRKYSAVRTEAVASGDAILDWDALSSGDDPTQGPAPSR